MKIGCLILAGGKSSRMGSKKSALEFHGITFLDKLAHEMNGFPELLVSVDERLRHPEITFPMVADIYPEHGPMGGLYSALLQCESDALLVIPCDVPLFSKELAEKMCSFYKETDTDALIAMTDDERIHPLCGIYHKHCLSTLKDCLENEDLKMMSALHKLNLKYYPTGADSWKLTNVNTPEEYRRLIEKNILAISGYKDSGKTTLIEKLIPELMAYGLQVATIKHDGHSFVPDVPGTDSHRFYQAGAATSIVFDNEKFAVTKRMPPNLDYLLSLTGDADLIILEGFKETDYSKLEVVRKANEKPPINQLKNRLAYVSDMKSCECSEFDNSLPMLDMNLPKEVAAFIVDACHHGQLKIERTKS